MEDQRKVDFKKYAAPPASKWYLIRIVFYIVLLSGLLVFFFSQNSKQKLKNRKTNTIENVNITIEE